MHTYVCNSNDIIISASDREGERLEAKNNRVNEKVNDQVNDQRLSRTNK